MDNQNIVYMAYDGDNAGRLCGRAILADNPDALHEVSDRIQLGHEVVKRWVESHGGQFISGGGDEGVFSIPADAIHAVEELRADYKFATNLTATVGVGKTLSEAGKAMLVGKFRGKNTTVQYEPGIEQEIKQAQSHMSSGTASAEEKKISEAYLDEGTNMATENKAENHDDCPYCAEMAAQQTEDPNHCTYCHDLDAESDCQYCHDAEADGHPDDCQYCQQAANHDPSAAGHPDDCPYCAEADGAGSSAQPSDQVVPTDGPTTQNPTTTDSENYAGQDLNQPDLPKPDAIQQNPDGLGFTQDTPTNENIKLDVAGQGAPNYEQAQTQNQNIDPQSEETVEGIAQEIAAQPTSSNPEEQTVSAANTVNQVDDASLATSGAMEGNTARPDNYDQQNQDMGLAEEDQGQPDITGVMQEGLDSHSENIQREKVVNLVSEALIGFKGCKAILEKSKVQAPQLYEASIAMLKAMIEMAKMLGLDQEAQAPTGDDPLADDGGMAPAANDAAGGIPAYEQNGGGGSSNGSNSGPATSSGVGQTPNYENSKESGSSALPKTKGQ